MSVVIPHWLVGNNHDTATVFFRILSLCSDTPSHEWRYAFYLQTTRGFGDRWLLLHRVKEATAAGTMTAEEANLRRNLTTEVATVTQQLHQEDPLLFILCNKQQPSWWCLAKRNTSRTTRQQMAQLLALRTDFDTVSSPRTGVRHTTNKHKMSLATRQTSLAEETPNLLPLVLERGRAPLPVPKPSLRYKLMDHNTCVWIYFEKVTHEK